MIVRYKFNKVWNSSFKVIISDTQRNSFWSTWDENEEFPSRWVALTTYFRQNQTRYEEDEAKSFAPIVFY